ncbi:MAG: 7-cyano-7-deazaguanine synthase [Candidatus Aenigmarchaeota archaeon]|nr:7-cyano-7-deazaguanine synthase [Candidatus Aenigmarchaeota archaeon]
MTKSIVLLSGGIDSSTALWWAKNKDWEIYALTFKYGNWNNNEVNSAKRLAKSVKVAKHIIVDVNFLNQINDLKQFRELKNIPSTYIPSRNTVFFGIASHYSEIYGINYIVTGHSFIDPFPDSKPKYIKAINSALSHGNWLGKKYKTKIIMPLAKLDKIGIIKQAVKLKVPLELTWSCHKNVRIACGECNGCNSRLDAFKDLNLEDKISYNL